jgi:hypothetical protein
MTGDQMIDEAEARILRRASPDDVHDAACTILPVMRRMQECLRWAGGQRIGPGGIAHADLSRIMSAAARGADWKELRDQALARNRR